MNRFDITDKMLYKSDVGINQQKVKVKMFETNSQLVKQILELCEAYNMPPEIIALVKNKCWKLTKNEKEEENAKEIYTSNFSSNG